MPKNGTPCSRAYSAAFIMPRVPREPKPPGTRMPCGAVEQRARRLRVSSASASTQFSRTFSRWAKPPWIDRLVEALVRVLVAGVLADDVNGELVGRVLDAIDQLLPGLGARLGQRQAELLQDDLVEPLGLQHERHFVDRVDVLRGDDRFFGDVAEERDLALDVGVEEPVGAAEQDVGLDADRAQVADAVLRRLGLQLAGRADERHQRQVDVERVLAADVEAELADRLEERHALDVADRAADLDEHDVHVARRRGGWRP